jgi:hypothetical protein
MPEVMKMAFMLQTMMMIKLEMIMVPVNEDEYP